MPDLTLQEAVEQTLAVIREGFEGPPEKWSYFTDHGPEGGLFGTLAKLDSANASKKIGKTSIAAHVNHLVFSNEAVAAWIRGNREPRNWKDSWKVETVNDEEWKSMIASLKRTYDDVKKAVETDSDKDIMSLGAAIGEAAHIGYHLGAIRQKIAHL